MEDEYFDKPPAIVPVVIYLAASLLVYGGFGWFVYTVLTP